MQTNFKNTRKNCFSTISTKEKLFIRSPKHIREAYFIFRRRTRDDTQIFKKLRRSKCLLSISHRNSTNERNKPHFYVLLKYQGRFLKEVNPRFRRGEYNLLVGRYVKYLRKLENVILSTNTKQSWMIFFLCREIKSLSIYFEKDENRIVNSIERIKPLWLKKSLIKLKRHMANIKRLSILRANGFLTSTSIIIFKILNGLIQNFNELSTFSLFIAEAGLNDVTRHISKLNLWQSLTVLDYTASKSLKNCEAIISEASKGKLLERLLINFDGKEEKWSILKYICEFTILRDFHLTILSQISNGAYSFFKNFTLPKNLKRLELTLDDFCLIDESTSLEEMVSQFPQFFESWSDFSTLKEIYLILRVPTFCCTLTNFLILLLGKMTKLSVLNLSIQEQHHKKSKDRFDLTQFFVALKNVFLHTQDVHIEAPRISFENFPSGEFVLRNLFSLVIKSQFDHSPFIQNFLSCLKPTQSFTLKFHREAITLEELHQQLMTIINIPKISVLRITFLMKESNSEKLRQIICELMTKESDLKALVLQLDKSQISPEDMQEIQQEFEANNKLLLARIITPNIDKAFQKSNALDYYFLDDE